MSRPETLFDLLSIKIKRIFVKIVLIVVPFVILNVVKKIIFTPDPDSVNLNRKDWFSNVEFQKVALRCLNLYRYGTYCLNLGVLVTDDNLI